MDRLEEGSYARLSDYERRQEEIRTEAQVWRRRKSGEREFASRQQRFKILGDGESCVGRGGGGYARTWRWTVEALEGAWAGGVVVGCGACWGGSAWFRSASASGPRCNDDVRRSSDWLGDASRGGRGGCGEHNDDDRRV
ncbi:uncharacterized protein A4U43_C10F13990 [Asparagus officinalis]|uniref:Uncharacterized protein n=1 Tax=Asparagus officinalis TaxID=4686 RepID=A0A5P1E2V6_ASPOF|nr:uncharacterized protein A4U43_C10F13990 [Asparagus officinalis]